MPFAKLLALALPAVLLAAASSAQRIVLRDVSKKAGLDYSFGPKKTYGGPSIADLDDDGYPDLLITHHDNHFIEVYFNERDGTFAKVPLSELKVWADTHALNAFRYGPHAGAIYFAMSRGGAFGNRPAHNRFFRVSRNRSITEVTDASDSDAHSGRGRSTLFLPLRSRTSAKADMLSLNAQALDRRLVHHVAFRNAARAPRFARRDAPGYSHNNNWYGAYCDYDNDGVIDVVSFETLRFHRVRGNFRLLDVTDDVLPKGFRPNGVVSVSELDFDNDGLWDLYVATTRTGDLYWRKGEHRDYLLRNVGGRYVDVTKRAGIPQDGLTRGVSAADMDNDGLIDLVVSKYWGRSVVLRNVGGGRFRAMKGVIPARLRAKTPSDGIATADLDLDGRVDVVLSEGSAGNPPNGGFVRIFSNASPRTDRHYLLVRVGNAPSGKATPLHAVVRVRAGGRSMMRRVGAPGVSVSVSLVETLHFGLGTASTAARVTVTWLDGSSRSLYKVAGDRVITVGRTARTRAV